MSGYAHKSGAQKRSGKPKRDEKFVKGLEKGKKSNQ